MNRLKRIFKNRRIKLGPVVPVLVILMSLVTIALVIHREVYLDKTCVDSRTVAYLVMIKNNNLYVQFVDGTRLVKPARYFGSNLTPGDNYCNKYTHQKPKAVD